MAEMKVNRIVSHVSKVIYEWFLWLTGSSLAMKVQRSDSLARFLKQRPQQEELVQRHIIPTETEQQRLNHRQQIGATLNRSENSLAVFELLLSRVSLQRIGGGFIVSDTSEKYQRRLHWFSPRGPVQPMDPSPGSRPSGSQCSLLSSLPEGQCSPLLSVMPIIFKIQLKMPFHRLYSNCARVILSSYCNLSWLLATLPPPHPAVFWWLAVYI